jgi:N-acetyl-anhydromuramyl-L-alanine amidase AmpD
MGVGYLGLADVVRHTAASEWASRQGEPITTLQAHHTAYPNDEGSYQLMLPGGRTVSANYLLMRDGTLVEVVPGQFRAFTSATGFDRQCLTVETVNQTGAPQWGISEVQRRRLAKLHRDMAKAGLPTTPGRRGIGGLIGHSEVPGTYATACPGPDMNLDHIAAMAAADATAEPIPPREDTDMRYLHTPTRRALVGELTFTPYTPETHGGMNTQYQAAASAMFHGLEVAELTYDVARQDCYNRQADYFAKLTAASTGVDPVKLTADVKAAVQAALDDDDTDSDSIDVVQLAQALAPAVRAEFTKNPLT